MSHITAGTAPHASRVDPGYSIPPVKIDMSTATMEGGAWSGVARVLLCIGLLGLVVTIIGVFSIHDGGRHAFAAYLMGFDVSLGFSLGALGYCMIFQQMNAGWVTTLRRILESAASLFPVLLLFFLPVAIYSIWTGRLYTWMNPAISAEDILAHHKQPYLNIGFWTLRALFYFGIWSYLGVRLYRLSREQDRTADRWLTARARRMSAWGLPVYALTSAFAAFDWLMGLDYHWFSTMFGVYFFAGNILSATALWIIIVAALKKRGKLQGIVTEEHFHDMGKLLLTFTIFWAYITFSQYFLIWYSNIPEETQWFFVRKHNGWETVGKVLCFGHFLAPFLVLLWHASKRKTAILVPVALWVILMQCVDVFFIVRPAVYEDGGLHPEYWWLDLCGLIGPVGVYLSILVWKIASAPLVPVNDPRLAEAVHHKNYV
jgi:hypothetical protein